MSSPPLKSTPPEELLVYISHRDSECDECKENLGTGAWITLIGEKGANCLDCADLAHLTFLPAGDMALTRRSRKYSTLSAIVLKWSRARKRYERQGVLVEEAALARAEEECLADGDARERRRERQAIRREALDQKYIEAFAARVRELYPACPRGREFEIAEHACLKYSGRVGRSASAKTLDPQTVAIAVIAHVRHRETDYDRLLARGIDRREARALVQAAIAECMEKWR
jgi:hypothetical protein